MNSQPLSFVQLTERLKLFGVSLVKSPPAPTGMMYFIGSEEGEAFFPYAKGPVRYIQTYADNDILPVKQIHSIIKFLKIERAQFWSVQDHKPATVGKDASL